MRISEKTLSQLPASVSKPGYDRSKVVGSIVHLGIGAFHRAHQAMFTDAALAATGDLSWGLVGAGVISADMKNALMPQDGLYALAEMGADSEKVKIIGSIIDVFGGAEDAEKLLAKMSDVSTRIVSITVTEKGYYLDLATGKLQINAPAIAADLASPATPKTILGLIVQALKARKDVVESVTFVNDPTQWDIYPLNGNTGWTRDNYGPVWIPKRGATLKLTMDNIAIYERPTSTVTQPRR